MNAQLKFKLITFLAYLCGITGLYLHASELYNRQQGILTFLQLKSQLDEFRALVYSYFGSCLFLVMLVVQLYFTLKKKQNSSLVVSTAILFVFLLSFLIDLKFYYG